MIVNAIRPYASNNYSNNNTMNCRRKNVSAPNFQAAVGVSEMDRILKMLAPKNVAVYDGNMNMKKIAAVMDELIAKYKTKSAAIQIVSDNKDLVKLLGKTTKYDLNDKIGLCVAVGDYHGPIERWTEVYEAKTFLVPKNELSRIMCKN
ncbi:MAG: hypothetical protein ACI37Q_07985 [Candidatus Gastranaerophilaceae bacterium]